LGGDGSGGNSFVATIAIVSLNSLIGVVQKEERKNDKKRDKQRQKKKKL